MGVSRRVRGSLPFGTAPADLVVGQLDHMDMILDGASDGTTDGSTGARFFDDKKQDRGWAKKVTRRAKAIGRLTVLDVVTNEPALTSFLAGLDRSSLRVQCTDIAGASYTFEWASGYENGTQIRIQGVLVGG